MRPPHEGILDELGPLYHSYALFGARNRQLPGNYEPNQKCKAPILQAYIHYAIAKCKRRASDPVSFAELFCADGYYAMVARLFGASECFGIDNNRDGLLTLAPRIAEKLGLDNIQFLCMDVNDIDRLPAVDIVGNFGGLYHVTNPQEILAKSYRMARKFLIVQTVVSLANHDPGYFETPAPGWSHGCRFSKAWLLRLVEDSGYQVIDSHFNELEGNDRPEDRGSLYLLIRK